MKTLEDFKNGQLLLIDKPLGWTSFQVVSKLGGPSEKLSI
jgi:tRNA pseudouridine55 synthase